MAQDRIDTLITQWRTERPDLNASPMGILGRLMILQRLAKDGVVNLLRPHNITIPEFDVLAILRRCGPPFRRSAGELCVHSLLSSGAMTNRIDRLEQKGLVERLPNPEDRRGVLVTLTVEGRALIDRLVEERLQEAQDRVSVLSDSDRVQLEALLARFLEALPGNPDATDSPPIAEQRGRS
jgi:DNA-binding MarR family transcriptional regulator